MVPIVLRRAGFSMSIVWTMAMAGPSARAGDDLGSGASALFAKYCRECHANRSSKVPQFDLVDRPSLLAPSRKGLALVVPGKPEESLLWERLGVLDDMPPAKKPRPSDDEKDLIRRWIVEGAPSTAVSESAPTPSRPPLGERDAMVAMIRYLEELPEEDRPLQRFFTLTIPYNREILAKAGRKPPSLAIYRAALSKMVNSLSQGRDIVLPRAIDPEKTVYVVDLRDLGWDVDRTWEEVKAAYPYGLQPSDHVTSEPAENLQRLAGDDLPYVRADWFIANASQPPLYYAMLHLAPKLEDFEKELGVEAFDNFLKGKVARAGFHESGISEQNRLIERHRTRHGAYWKSYDFKAGGDERNIFLRPLGPVSKANPNPNLAFRHDGGEMIFSLPNGLQGYYLADASGTRLNKAPTEIVNSPIMIESDSQVVVGISCIACHNEGIKDPKGGKDELRDQFQAGRAIRQLIEERHPRPGDFAALVERDRRRFTTALREATAPYLDSGQTGDPEVISVVARDHFQRIDLDNILIELGYTGPDLEQHRLEVRACLKKMALADPASPALARRDWQSPSATFQRSAFHEMAELLKLGEPLTFSVGVR